MGELLFDEVPSSFSSCSRRALIGGFFESLLSFGFEGAGAAGPAHERTASSICSAVERLFLSFPDPDALTEVVRFMRDADSAEVTA